MKLNEMNIHNELQRIQIGYLMAFMQTRASVGLAQRTENSLI